MAASVDEEVGAKYGELRLGVAEVKRLSEYDGGWALSKGVGKIGSALDSGSGWCSKLVKGDRGAFSEGTANSRLSPSVVTGRPLDFSGGKIMSELESGGGGGGVERQ